VVTRRSHRRFINLDEIVALAEEVRFKVPTSDVMCSSSSTKSKKNTDAPGPAAHRQAELVKDIYHNVCILRLATYLSAYMHQSVCVPLLSLHCCLLTRNNHVPVATRDLKCYVSGLHFISSMVNQL
jgi:hypothetical protein